MKDYQQQYKEWKAEVEIWKKKKVNFATKKKKAHEQYQAKLQEYERAKKLALAPAAPLFMKAEEAHAHVNNSSSNNISGDGDMYIGDGDDNGNLIGDVIGNVNDNSMIINDNNNSSPLLPFQQHQQEQQLLHSVVSNGSSASHGGSLSSASGGCILSTASLAASPPAQNNNGLCSSLLTSSSAVPCSPSPVLPASSSKLLHNPTTVGNGIINNGIGPPPVPPTNAKFGVPQPTKPLMPKEKFFYNATHRQLLFDWASSTSARNESWGADLANIFGKLSEESLLIGSPVLDFHVSGDDTNVQSILWDLRSAKKSSSGGGAAKKTESDNVLSATLAAATTNKQTFNWVQCENPNCMKWRRLPWFVDTAALPEMFRCEDNKWEQDKASCDVPEDPWSEASEKTLNGALLKVSDLVAGAKLDVYRKAKASGFRVGEILAVDLVKKQVSVKFKISGRPDDVQWVEVDEGFTKFAPLHFYTKVNRKRAAAKTSSKSSAQSSSNKRGKQDNSLSGSAQSSKGAAVLNEISSAAGAAPRQKQKQEETNAFASEISSPPPPPPLSIPPCPDSCEKSEKNEKPGGSTPLTEPLTPPLPLPTCFDEKKLDSSDPLG